MTEFTEFLSHKVLNSAFDAAAWTAVSAVHLSLQTTTSTDTTPGTEVTNANGYSRNLLSFAAAAASATTNDVAETFTASGGNFGTVVSTSIWDSITHAGGNMFCYDNDFTDTAVNNGDTLSFAIGDIDITLA